MREKRDGDRKKESRTRKIWRNPPNTLAETVQTGFGNSEKNAGGAHRPKKRKKERKASIIPTTTTSSPTTTRNHVETHPPNLPNKNNKRNDDEHSLTTTKNLSTHTLTHPFNLHP